MSLPSRKPRLGARDEEYIVNRLLAPCNEAMEAHGRLVQAGLHGEAARLMAAMQALTDECREIRLSLRQHQS